MLFVIPVLYCNNCQTLMVSNYYIYGRSVFGSIKSVYYTNDTLYNLLTSKC